MPAACVNSPLCPLPKESRTMAIIAHIDHRQALREQVLHHPFWKTVLDWLATLDDNTPAGEHTLDRQTPINATVVETLTHSWNGRSEAHRNFIDVHFCLRGVETIYYAPICHCLEDKPYDQKTDTAMLRLRTMGYHEVKATPGTIVIFFPEDAHAPLLNPSTSDSPLPVKKAIVKIPLPALC